ncbi:DMT family transporter [Gephyromycinifex aptenodytis]|uniref:DMT family transporter n=1 Tax=Gephyromycinifex aptenodytis TaxID=2716227 RepID=UPI001444E8E7|nr:DMT family transporter [Gephyromycinifex aptenodytis]
MRTEPRTAKAAAALSVAAAFGVGVASSIQARANGTLSTAFGSALDAALWSFISGWTLLTIGLLWRRSRTGLVSAYGAYRAHHLQWWQFLGGLGGGLFVATQTWVVPQVGVALFTISLVGGQTANALLVDKIGLGPGGRSAVTPARVLAALGTFIGVTVAVLARGQGNAAPPVLPVLLAVVAGAGLAVQAAVNGRVNRHSGSVMATAWINFTWGLVFVGSWAATQLVGGALQLPLTWQAPWWAFFGGVLGILFVAVSAVVVHTLGVLLTTLFTLAGQLMSAVVLDALTPGGAHHVSAQLVLGVIITLVSAASAGIAAQRAKRRLAETA